SRRRGRGGGVRRFDRERRIGGRSGGQRRVRRWHDRVGNGRQRDDRRGGNDRTGDRWIEHAGRGRIDHERDGGRDGGDRSGRQRRDRVGRRRRHTGRGERRLLVRHGGRAPDRGAGLGGAAGDDYVCAPEVQA